MSIFGGSKSDAPPPPSNPAADIPVLGIDLSKRYDIYCAIPGEDRLYEDVRIVAIRTFEPNSQIRVGVIGGYLEVAAQDDTRMMIPHLRIYMICEHGVHPGYRVLRTRVPRDE